LHVQKDIIAWAQSEDAVGTLSFIDQTFSPCDDDGEGERIHEDGGLGSGGNNERPRLERLNCADGCLSAFDQQRLADIDNNGQVDFVDFLTRSANFGQDVADGDLPSCAVSEF